MGQLLRQLFLLFLAAFCLGTATPAMAIKAQSELSGQALSQVDKPENDSVLATPQQNGLLRQGVPLQEDMPVQEVGLDVRALQKSGQASRRTEGLQSETTEVPAHHRRWDAFRSKVVSFRFVSGSVLGERSRTLPAAPTPYVATRQATWPGWARSRDFGWWRLASVTEQAPRWG